MTALLLATLVASLLGSLHCIGMCGGLVAVVAGPGCARLRGGLGDQAAYHAGRGAAYALVGFAAGGLGAGLDGLGALGGLQRLASVVIGAAMVLWGLHALLVWRGLVAAPRGTTLARILPIGRVLAALTAPAGGAPAVTSPTVRALLLGALTPLLPCGWLWLFVVAAAGTGGALRGASVLLAFWLGTVPALLGLGLGLRALAGRLRDHLPWLRAVTLVGVGLFTLAGRATVVLPPAPSPAPAPAAPATPAPLATSVGPGFAPEVAPLETARRAVEQADDALPPCCRHDP